jgi:hypothetical protein
LNPRASSMSFAWLDSGLSSRGQSEPSFNRPVQMEV